MKDKIKSMIWPAGLIAFFILSLYLSASVSVDFYNNDNTLRVKIPSAEFQALWKQLQPENDSGIRLTCTAGEEAETLVDLEFMQTAGTSELAWFAEEQYARMRAYYEASGAVFTAFTEAPVQGKVGEYPALIASGVFTMPEREGQLHLTLVAAQAEQGYILVQMLGNAEPEDTCWRVVHTARVLS